MAFGYVVFHAAHEPQWLPLAGKDSQSADVSVPTAKCVWLVFGERWICQAAHVPAGVASVVRQEPEFCCVLSVIVCSPAASVPVHVKSSAIGSVGRSVRSAEVTVKTGPTWSGFAGAWQ